MGLHAVVVMMLEMLSLFLGIWLLFLLLAQEGAVSQYEHMASVRQAIEPLWEQARFDERYVLPAHRRVRSAV